MGLGSMALAACGSVADFGADMFVFRMKLSKLHNKMNL